MRKTTKKSKKRIEGRQENKDFQAIKLTQIHERMTR